MKEISENVKAIDVVRQMVADGQVSKDVAEKYFPELKDSEDETIRKRLIEYFKDFRLGTFAYLEPKKIIAWLEKQGTPAKLNEEEQNRFAKGVLTSCALSFINYLDAHKYEGKMCVSNGECEDIENAFHNAMWDRLHRYYCKYIEKQGEQILANSAKTCKDEQKPYGKREECYDCQMNYGGTCKGSCAMKRGEQKSADKVEPFDKYEGLTDFERALADICMGWIGEEYGWKQYIKDNADVLLKIAVKMFNSVQDAPFEQESANWSEEGEKIRNWLIGYFHQYKKDGIEKYANGLKVESIIAWLEQQGEKPQGKSALEAVNEEKVDNANKVEPKDYNDIDPHFGKPIDKVEPKFKVGDWIVDKSGLVQHVLGFRGGIYTCTYSSFTTGCESNYHLWSIADAKDGDVLKEGSCIFILRKMKSENTAITHCCLFDDGDFNLSPTLSLDVDSTFPATKEQRAILFQKMSDAGYAFDLDKKEMMKIEDLLITDVEIPFGAKDSELEEVFYSIPNGFHAEIEGDKVVIKKGEQKPAAWSEEDKSMLCYMEGHLEYLKNDKGYSSSEDQIMLKRQLGWLKTLKDRVQPQNIWKPSDEQIGALEHFVRNIAESGFASPYDSNTKLVYSLLNDLKKLKL